jgi:hypothetical protein
VRFSDRSFFVLPVTVLALFLSLTAAPSLCADGAWVGGPCRYKSYSGRATILSVTAVENNAADQTKRFDVLFTFQAQDEIEESFARTEGKTFSLYGKYFSTPDRNFITVHRLAAGRILDGSMQVIVAGTCTPVVFDFPELNEDE